jgi:hypothetical protein
MKRLLSMLFSRNRNNIRGDDEWWHLSVSDEGDPPDERQYMFTLDALIAVIKSKLKKLSEKE